MISYAKLALTALEAAGVLTKVLVALGLVASLLTAYGVWHHEVYQGGVSDTLARIARADERMVQRALQMRGKLLLCQEAGRSWNQSTGGCQ